MKINNCRNCNSKKISKLFTLGKMSFTGKFAKSSKIDIPKAVVSLIICKVCKLVQLDRNFNPRYLYDTGYGYRTGINFTMRKHVKDVVKESVKLVKLKKNEAVLDIASNDGTLLNYYKKNTFTVGIDPLIKKYRSYYKNINYGIQDFFSFNAIKKKKLKKSSRLLRLCQCFMIYKIQISFYRI